MSKVELRRDLNQVQMKEKDNPKVLFSQLTELERKYASLQSAMKMHYRVENKGKSEKGDGPELVFETFWGTCFEYGQ